MRPKRMRAQGPQIRKSDWVICTSIYNGVGLVLRVGRNGLWADVRWRFGGSEWVKRMATEHLRVTTRLEGKNFEGRILALYDTDPDPLIKAMREAIVELEFSGYGYVADNLRNALKQKGEA